MSISRISADRSSPGTESFRSSRPAAWSADMCSRAEIDSHRPANVLAAGANIFKTPSTGPPEYFGLSAGEGFSSASRFGHPGNRTIPPVVFSQPNYTLHPVYIRWRADILRKENHYFSGYGFLGLFRFYKGCDKDLKGCEKLAAFNAAIRSRDGIRRIQGIRWFRG